MTTNTPAVERETISIPHFRASKIGGPVVCILFFLGVGIYSFCRHGGVLLLDVLLGVAVLTGIILQVWILVTLRHVELEGDDVIVSDLKSSVRIPKTSVVAIRYRPGWKYPPCIPVRDAEGRSKKIRFSPAVPRAESIARLRAFVGLEVPAPTASHRSPT